MTKDAKNEANVAGQAVAAKRETPAFDTVLREGVEEGASALHQHLLKQPVKLDVVASRDQYLEGIKANREAALEVEGVDVNATNKLYDQMAKDVQGLYEGFKAKILLGVNAAKLGQKIPSLMRLREEYFSNMDALNKKHISEIEKTYSKNADLKTTQVTAQNKLYNERKKAETEAFSSALAAEAAAKDEHDARVIGTLFNTVYRGKEVSERTDMQVIDSKAGENMHELTAGAVYQDRYGHDIKNITDKKTGEVVGYGAHIGFFDQLSMDKDGDTKTNDRIGDLIKRKMYDNLKKGKGDAPIKLSAKRYAWFTQEPVDDVKMLQRAWRIAAKHYAEFGLTDINEITKKISGYAPTKEDMEFAQGMVNKLKNQHAHLARIPDAAAVLDKYQHLQKVNGEMSGDITAWGEQYQKVVDAVASVKADVKAEGLLSEEDEENLEQTVDSLLMLNDKTRNQIKILDSLYKDLDKENLSPEQVALFDELKKTTQENVDNHLNNLTVKNGGALSNLQTIVKEQKDSAQEDLAEATEEAKKLKAELDQQKETQKIVDKITQDLSEVGSTIAAMRTRKVPEEIEDGVEYSEQQVKDHGQLSILKHQEADLTARLAKEKKKQLPEDELADMKEEKDELDTEIKDIKEDVDKWIKLEQKVKDVAKSTNELGQKRAEAEGLQLEARDQKKASANNPPAPAPNR